MSDTWKDQVALITGGASGIGLATAQRLSGLGARLVLVDLGAERLAAAAAKIGEGTLTAEADVSDERAVKRAVDAALEAHGRIDIAINSAGIAGQTNIKGHEVPVHDFKRVVEVNLTGSFVVSKMVLPAMLDRGYGRILLIASIAGKEGNAGMVSYSASKAGVIGLTKSLGKEYAGTGITVNALAPAVIRTPIVEALPQAQIDYMTSKIPMNRCGTLDEVATLIAFIVSPENSFTTGFCYDLSGGRAVY